MAHNSARLCLCALVCASIPLFAAAGCRAGLKSNDVAGTYTVRYPFGEGMLRLHIDGRYEQTLRINGREASVTGRWTWVRKESWDLLSLKNCLVATNGFGQLNERWDKASENTCQPAVAKRFHGLGAIQIVDDENYRYQQTEPLPRAMLAGGSSESTR
jgi:hypothetical protein